MSSSGTTGLSGAAGSGRPDWLGGSRRERRQRGATAIVLLVMAVLLACAVGLWRLKVANDLREGAYERATVSGELARRAEALIGAEVRRARGLAQRFSQESIQNVADFNRAVAEETGASDAYCAVAWVSREGICQYAWAKGAEPLLKQGARLRDSATWAHALTRARVARRARVVYVSHEPNGAQMLFVVPTNSDEAGSGEYLGSVAARVDVGAALRGLLPQGAEANYDVELSDGRAALLRRGAAIEDDAVEVDSEAVRAADRFWNLRVRPGAAAVAAAPSALWVLYAGVGCAAGLSWLVAGALRRRYEAAVEAGRQVEAMSSLTQTAGVILAEPGAGGEALNRLAASARKLLGMSRAVVCVADASLETVRVVASDGDWADPGGSEASFPLTAMGRTRECMARGEVIAVEDAVVDGGLSQGELEGFDLRSALFVPLTFENRSIGSMCVADRVPRRFTESELQLARVLGAQAGVILANHRLYQEKVAALAAQKELTRRHESLYQLATEIFRGQDLEMSLQRLADAAPALLGVDVCLLTLRIGDDQTRVEAVTGGYADCKAEEDLARESNVGRVLHTREAVTIEDAANDSTLHPSYRQRLRPGSIMYLPLIGADRAIGTMVLVRHARGAFTAEQKELAEVLAARAAVAIHTATLHEQARQSAQTQEVLLRELNHRVKNNLASIVALLSLNRPSMPAEAMTWLNRASDRIATMARTHDLFVGGSDRIGLQDLVAKLLPALSLIKPSGVEVLVDLDGVQVELCTDRAVSMAMVLNELCWNALEHGSGSSGFLRIRGYDAGGRQLVLEVEDDGGGDGCAVEIGAGAGSAGAGSWKGPNRSGRGTGLRLVEGLVSRELRGRFQIRRASGGGTVARVEIPLEAGEIGTVSI